MQQEDPRRETYEHDRFLLGRWNRLFPSIRKSDTLSWPWSGVDCVHTYGIGPLVCHSFTWGDDSFIPRKRRYIRISEQVLGCRCRLRLWLDVLVSYTRSRLLMDRQETE